MRPPHLAYIEIVTGCPSQITAAHVLAYAEELRRRSGKGRIEMAKVDPVLGLYDKAFDRLADVSGRLRGLRGRRMSKISESEIDQQEPTEDEVQQAECELADTEEDEEDPWAGW